MVNLGPCAWCGKDGVRRFPVVPARGSGRSYKPPREVVVCAEHYKQFSTRAEHGKGK